ncbi:MAG: hypothetical protein EPO35_08100 [Acidobacteria bacterium]|nr:MAG: hypothetical protein EPO35_08100 [Acidobacteriota bacterium]
MTARSVVAIASLSLALAASSACLSFYEIGIETPIQAKLDTSPFQRVLVLGFVSGGTKDVDVNSETVRLLRSQLRTKSNLKVIDSDVVSLVDVVDKLKANVANQPAGAAPGKEDVKSEKDLEAYDSIFADVAYWKKLGEEYQNPLIVTGVVYFADINKSGIVERPTEVYDALGKRSVVSVRQWMDRKGYAIAPKFVFIDGRTGTQLYTDSYREETLYSSTQNTPALSSYFELMDRLVPGFLNTLSSQKIKSTRVLLK